MAALGILLEEEETLQIFDYLARGSEAIGLEMYLSFLTERTQDVAPAQVRAAFIGLANGQPHLTPSALSRLPSAAVDHLMAHVPMATNGSANGSVLDFSTYLDKVLPNR